MGTVNLNIILRMLYVPYHEIPGKAYSSTLEIEIGKLRTMGGLKPDVPNKIGL